ncbi:hypothetical protein PAMA_018969 [Pampus argenteus]
MDKESSKTGRSSSLGRRKTINSSRQQSPLAVKDGRTRAKKRQASPDMETPPQKVLKAEPCNTSQENVSMKRLKRKVWEDGDEKDNSLQEKRKRKRVFDLLDDEEAASSSTDTGRESINNPLEGCSTSLAVKGVKRKATTDREGPARKKKSPHLKQTKETEEVFTSSPRGSYINTGSRVLIVSRQGRSRCSAVTTAFLMHHLKYTLEIKLSITGVAVKGVTMTTDNITNIHKENISSGFELRGVPNTGM